MSKFKKAVRGMLNRETGFSLIGMLLALVIIAILYLLIIRVYFGGSPASRETEEFLNEQGIDTNNYQGLIKSTREKREEINKELERRGKYLEEIK